MRITTKFNRSKVTFGLRQCPGIPHSKKVAVGVKLEIVTSDSDDDDTYASTWLTVGEAENFAYGLLRLIKSKE